MIEWAGWIIAAAAVCALVCVLACARSSQISRTEDDEDDDEPPAPGEGSPRPAAAIPPRGPQVPGLPWPPQHDCGAVIEHIEVEILECGCHRKLDHLRRKRKVHHCGRLDFDVNEWERRLTL